MEEQNKTSTGLTENIAGLLCYALGFVTGIIFILIEKENKFVRFHAMQSIITFVALWVLIIGIGVFVSMSRMWALTSLSSVIMLIELILWILLMYKAYQGERYKLPIIGDIAEQNTK